MIKLRSWKPNIVSVYTFKSVLLVDDRDLNAHHFLRCTFVALFTDLVNIGQRFSCNIYLKIVIINTIKQSNDR